MGFWLDLAEQGRHCPDLIALWCRELPPTLLSWFGVRLPSREAGMSGGTRKLSLSFDARDEISDLRDEKSGQVVVFFFFEKWILFKPFQLKGFELHG